MNLFMDILVDSLMDGLKLLPWLFAVYLLVEYLEHKNNTFVHDLFHRTKKTGPILGALFGIVPQCGFSVIASELFSKRAISMGTLIAIFVATSDEAVPLMLAHPEKIKEMLLLIGLKFVIAVSFGMLIDVLVRNTTLGACENEHHEHKHFHGNCESCEGGIFKSAIIHSIRIFLFIFIINVVLGFFADSLAPFMRLISNNCFIQATLTSLFGIIPNCAASVVLTELYLDGIIGFPALVGGLCTGAGVGLVVLFKQNKNLKQNSLILLSVYAIGVVSAMVIGLFL